MVNVYVVMKAFGDLDEEFAKLETSCGEAHLREASFRPPLGHRVYKDSATGAGVNCARAIL